MPPSSSILEYIEYSFFSGSYLQSLFAHFFLAPTMCQALCYDETTNMTHCSWLSMLFMSHLPCPQTSNTSSSLTLNWWSHFIFCWRNRSQQARITSSSHHLVYNTSNSEYMYFLHKEEVYSLLSGVLDLMPAKLFSGPLLRHALSAVCK